MSFLDNFFGKVYSHFFESYIFSQDRKIMVTLTKWCSLQKSVSKFTPKSFMRSTPGFNLKKMFWNENHLYRLETLARVIP